LYYFLGMSDPEIAAHLNLVRRTVAYRRTSSLQELKKFMEGKADE
ncbi:MAG: sigma-70 family RNA polymerase sigma factor, partial [Lachnospiraceae bacterium]|nr:sigma-70 family RNA polymerase sigma factor [Lachnospiraceae bacterium]